MIDMKERVREILFTTLFFVLRLTKLHRYGTETYILFLRPIFAARILPTYFASINFMHFRSIVRGCLFATTVIKIKF